MLNIYLNKALRQTYCCIFINLWPSVIKIKPGSDYHQVMSVRNRQMKVPVLLAIIITRVFLCRHTNQVLFTHPKTPTLNLGQPVPTPPQELVHPLFSPLWEQGLSYHGATGSSLSLFKHTYWWVNVKWLRKNIRSAVRGCRLRQSKLATAIKPFKYININNVFYSVTS